uniref:Uncharacterized protein n=1 Tax=Timema cristinae TaxID=61476 RepID=A0A7R9DD06_TIMCR|nr:unnamed protein product [Timema cristinae]
MEQGCWRTGRYRGIDAEEEEEVGLLERQSPKKPQPAGHLLVFWFFLVAEGYITQVRLKTGSSGVPRTVARTCKLFPCPAMPHSRPENEKMSGESSLFGELMFPFSNPGPYSQSYNVLVICRDHPAPVTGSRRLYSLETKEKH